MIAAAASVPHFQIKFPPFLYVAIKLLAVQQTHQLTHGRLTTAVLLQLVFLYAVVGPLAKGGNTGHWVRMRVWVGRGGIDVEVERSQQGGGRLAAGGGRAAVGDGGVRPLEGVFK